MMKIFCDHCGREIKGVEVNELSCDECFYDHETKDFVGSGYTLCAKCWDERQQAHINLDKEFLNIENEVEDAKPTTRCCDRNICAQNEYNNQLPVNESRSLCKLRHKNGNCLCVGGFCTAVNDEICKAVRMSYEKGYVDGKADEEEETSNEAQHTECKINLYTETKLRFVLDECIKDEELIEKILKALDEAEK